MKYDSRWSPRQLAAEAGVHISTVWRWIQRGVRGRRLRSLVIGGRRWIAQTDFDAFIRLEPGDAADRQVEGSKQSPSPAQKANAGQQLDSILSPATSGRTYPKERNRRAAATDLAGDGPAIRS